MLRDLKKAPGKKETPEVASTAIDLGGFLGVPIYELTVRDERAREALETKYNHPNCSTDEFSETLDSYLNVRYPWRCNKTDCASTSPEGKADIQQKLRDAYRYALENDFNSLFNINKAMYFFNFSVKDLPDLFWPRFEILQDRTSNVQQEVFRCCISNAICCLEMIWDSLRTYPELIDELRPKNQTIYQLCFVRDLIVYNAPVPEVAWKEGEEELSVHKTVDMRMPSLARCTYFVLRFIGYTYLEADTQLQSSELQKDKGPTLSTEAFTEIFDLLGSAADDYPRLEDRLCEMLCRVFHLKDRAEAQKHDWFNFFTFTDWTWLTGRDLSFLDLVPAGETDFSSSPRRQPISRGSSCQCQEEESTPICQMCLRELKNLLLVSQKFHRLISSNAEYLETIWTEILHDFMSWEGAVTAKERRVLDSLGVAFPRLVAHALDRMVVMLHRNIEIVTEYNTKVICKSPENLSRLQYMGQLAILRYYTEQTGGVSSGDNPLQGTVGKYFHDKFKRIHGQLDDLRLCVLKLQRDLFDGGVSQMDSRKPKSRWIIHALSLSIPKRHEITLNLFRAVNCMLKILFSLAPIFPPV